MLTVCWALFGILEIGNLVEEPFTAVVSSTSVLMHLLPLTEVCRTIRRDVRSIAQYSAIGKNYSVPTIQQFPSKTGMPDNFKTLRELATNSSNATKRRTERTAQSAGSKVNGSKLSVPAATPFMTRDFLRDSLRKR